MYSEILDKLDEETALHNLTPRSCIAYRATVDQFLKATGKDPSILTDDDARAYLLAKQQSGIKAQTYNHYHGGIHFFYRYVLRAPWDPNKVPRMKRDIFLPTVLTRAEVFELLNAEMDLKYKAMYTLMYSSGLRLSEVIHLHYEDISRKTMLIHVRKSKSRQDRYVILSQVALATLTEYWQKCGKPKDILFPSRWTGSYLNINSVEQKLRACLKRTSINKHVTPHSLRHSFATHLMEDGVEIRFIQALLGHRDPRSTEIYLHISDKSLIGVKSPLDTMFEGGAL
jgi:site-specific recombinase XerD